MTKPESFEPTPLVPAATVILLRECDGQLQTLLLRRNRSLKAFGGAWVFPGGRVDDLDLPGGDDVDRARQAAIRETHEETGLDISRTEMAPLSRWIPPPQEKKRFSTWFFVAKAPDGDVRIDQGEIHDYQWSCPKRVVADTPNPDLLIMPPTFVSLYELAKFDKVETAISTIGSRTPELFETRFMRTDTGFATLWSPDAGYEQGDLNAPGPRRRLVCEKTAWRYQKSG